MEGKEFIATGSLGLCTDNIYVLYRIKKCNSLCVPPQKENSPPEGTTLNVFIIQTVREYWPLLSRIELLVGVRL